MSVLEIVLLVVGILLINGVLWFFLVRWLRGRSGKVREALAEELRASGEAVERPPEPALYRGASAELSKVKGNGLIALTERRVVFRKLTGGPIEVDRSRIVGVREDKWFLRSYFSGRMHVIVQLDGGTEVGFIVDDHAAWAAALSPD